jgi:hypothetical protein
MTEAQLGKVEGTNEALDRPDRIVRPNILLDPWRKQVRLIPALAGLECTIRHEPNRTSILEKAEFLPDLDGQISKSAVQPLSQKYFRSHPKQITFLSPPSGPGRGALAIVTNVGIGCGGRGGAFDEQRQGGRRSRVVLMPRRWHQVGGCKSTGEGGKKARSPGRARSKP